MNQNLVLDTNILISGYLWGGKPRQAIRLVKSGNFILLHCRKSIDELVRVLSLKFRLSASEIYRIVLDIKNMGEEINIISKEHPVREDPADDLFINLAIDGNSKTIVSGDSHLLKLGTYKGIEIISVSEFLEVYA